MLNDPSAFDVLEPQAPYAGAALQVFARLLDEHLGLSRLETDDTTLTKFTDGSSHALCGRTYIAGAA